MAAHTHRHAQFAHRCARGPERARAQKAMRECTRLQGPRRQSPATSRRPCAAQQVAGPRRPRRAQPAGR
eukprot:1729606-Heterocapsa_arctica.AAC.1